MAGSSGVGPCRVAWVVEGEPAYPSCTLVAHGGGQPSLSLLSFLVSWAVQLLAISSNRTKA